MCVTRNSALGREKARHLARDEHRVMPHLLCRNRKGVELVSGKLGGSALGAYGRSGDLPIHTLTALSWNPSLLLQPSTQARSQNGPLPVSP
jgi:hypothetical protein